MSMDSKFDSTDRAIIAVLQNDARISNRELAQRVRLSPSACLARVRSLRERGVFTAFRAEVDLEAIGRPLEALVAIRLSHHERRVLDRLVDDLLAMPETTAVYHISGAEDYLVHVAVRDAQSLRDFVLDRLTVRAEIAQVQTSIVFQHHRSPGMTVLDDR